MKKTIIAFLISIWALQIVAQNDIPPLVTDRPDQSESSNIVLRNMVQIETGFGYMYDKSEGVEQEDLGIATTLIRWGILDNWEARLEFGYNSFRESYEGKTEEKTMSGFTPVGLGTKVFITEQKGLLPELAILAKITLPVGSDNYIPRYMAPGFRFAGGWDLGNAGGLGFNLGWESDGEKADQLTFFSLVYGFPISQKLNGYIESYNFFPDNDVPDFRSDAGITYLITNNFQLDLSGGWGFSEVSPDYFISFGFSWRVPH